MSAQRIAAADAVLASYAARFVGGNAALNNLVAALYGNPYEITGGDAGVPTGWTTGAPQVPIPMVAPVPGSVASLLDPIVNSGDRRRRRYRRLTEPGMLDDPGATFVCRPPQVIPFATSGIPASASPAPAAVSGGGISAGWWIALAALALAASRSR